MFLLFIALIACFVIALVVGFILLVVSTVTRKGRSGINFRRESCPKCGSGIPMVRMPANLKQALWGGYTCATCRTEIDKWGNQIAQKN